MPITLTLDLSIFGIQSYGGISVVWGEYLKQIPKYVSEDLQLLCRVPTNDNPIMKLLDLTKYRVEEIKARGRYSKYLPDGYRGGANDLLHMSYYAWYPRFKGMKIVTVHDFTHELFAAGLQKRMHTILKKKAIEGSHAVICISEATRNDLEKFYPGISGRKIVRVIPNAASTEFFPDHSVPEEMSTPYLLWVGGRVGYKNFDGALRFLKVLRDSGQSVKLIVVGPALSAQENRQVQYMMLDGFVGVELGVGMDRLRVLYSGAVGLLYLSKYEGFGLPILEAQRCHCPVVCLNIPSTAEVGGDSVLYLDGFEKQKINEVFAWLCDPQKRGKLIQTGRRNVDRYSWDKSVSMLVALYHELAIF